MLCGENKTPTYIRPITQLFNLLGHTTISGTRPIFPSLRAKISCKQCPERKYTVITNILPVVKQYASKVTMYEGICLPYHGHETLDLLGHERREYLWI